MARPTLLLVALLAAVAGPALAAEHDGDGKLDAVLLARAHAPVGASRVIIESTDGSPLEPLIRAAGGQAGRRLPLLSSQVARIPDAALDRLAGDPRVRAIRMDRPVHGTLERTGATVGTTWVREHLDVNGAGVGVAIIDSGVTSWHDDLGPSRVVHFADFVGFRPSPYDEYGHGTHVAGIIAGSGYDSAGARRGIAPGAHLVVLKVLDESGDGFISDVIAALDYAVRRRAEFNIRVVNLSVAAGVHESYTSDPLTLAARRAVEAGIVVVTAAGNFGRDGTGDVQHGGITAPGNAPWVLTVGAADHQGTAQRGDDVVAPFSSRGPSQIDFAAKPDVVAPGVGIESLADNGSTLYTALPASRLWGTLDTATPPYLSLTGTSMAAPVVAGTVALMMEANPALTPNLVKAILQFTAESHSRYDALTQGGGFLNARGAVQLALSLARKPVHNAKDPTRWSRHIVWGNQRVGGGVLRAGANAWDTSVTWGDTTTGEGAGIVWGTTCQGAECDNIVWGTAAAGEEDTIVWGTAAGEDLAEWGPLLGPVNVVWGTACGGTDCENTPWAPPLGVRRGRYGALLPTRLTGSVVAGMVLR